MAFDIKKNDPEVAAESGYTFALELPTGEVTDAKITIRGDNSKKVKEHGRRVYKEMEQQRVIAKRKGKEQDLSLEDLTEMSIDAAVVRIIKIEGIEEDGVTVESTPDNIRRLCTQYDFLRSQVLEQAANTFNFRSE